MEADVMSPIDLLRCRQVIGRQQAWTRLAARYVQFRCDDK